MGSALGMVVWITFLQKRDTRIITYASGTSKTQIDYTMMRNKDRKRVRDVKVIAWQKVPQQCDIMICAVKEIKKLFGLKRNVWRLNEETTRVTFQMKISENQFQRLAQASGQTTGIEDMWKPIKEYLLASSHTA